MIGKWIDASLNGSGPFSAKAYFFKADQYARYDWTSDKAEFGTEPILKAWKLPPVFAGDFNAALDGRGKYTDKAYFFKAGEYARYDWNSDRGDGGYPQPLTAWGLSGNFATGITACLNGEGPFAGKAYFFKGDSYVRYDWAKESLDAGYPKPLSAWKLPGVFAAGFDACVNGRGSYKGKAYFFKGDSYCRYDWAKDKPDQEPRPLLRNWPGLLELLTAGLAKSEAFKWIWAAQPQLVAYIASLQTGTPFTFPLPLVEQALRTHFHIDPGWPAHKKLGYLHIIAGNLVSLMQALDRSSAFFRARSDKEAAADGYAGPDGTASVRAYAAYNDKVSFTTLFPQQCGPMCRAAILTHETIHYVDQESGAANNHIPEWYEPPLSDPKIPKHYSSQTADEAIHNPCSYASFSAHLYYGGDRRYGYGRIMD
ncbi:MAG: hemopexin repeat-containing protein [Syntrophales bacterium]